MADSENEIAKLIEQYKSEPLLPLELGLIVDKINAENASVLDFKEQYKRDPLFCCYLIDLAWHKTQKRANHPFAADHAMSTVGIEGAKQYLASLSIKIDNKPLKNKTEFHHELKFIMSSSLLAAELAKNLCNNQQKSNNLYWASMAHQFPDLLLWYLKPKIMWRIQYRQIKLPKKLSIFEQAKLGFDLNQWRLAVAREWHMSETNHITYSKPNPQNRKQLIEYMRHGYSDETPALKEWHRTDSWQILTTNWLARSIMTPWLRNSYQHYFYIAQQAFNMNKKKLSHGILDSIRNTSAHLKGGQLFVPASSFLSMNSQCKYPDWLNASAKIPAKRDAKFIKNTAKLKQKSNKIAVENFIRELTKTPQKFANEYQLFRQVLQICIKQLGYSRASLLVVDWKNKQVATNLYFKQENCATIKPDFDFKQKTPLVKFLAGRTFLLFDKNKHEKIWNKLPREIIRQKVKHFILFSVKPDKRVKELIYLDLQGGQAPTTNKIKLTKLLLTAANFALQANTKKRSLAS